MRMLRIGLLFALSLLAAVALSSILMISIYGPPAELENSSERDQDLFNYGTEIESYYLLIFPALILTLFIIVSTLIHIRIRNFYPKFYKQEKFKVFFSKSCECSCWLLIWEWYSRWRSEWSSTSWAWWVPCKMRWTRVSQTTLGYCKSLLIIWIVPFTTW